MEAIINSVESGTLRGQAEIVLVFSNNPEAVGLESAAKKGYRTACISSRGKKRENRRRGYPAFKRPVVRQGRSRGRLAAGADEDRCSTVR